MAPVLIPKGDGRGSKPGDQPRLLRALGLWGATSIVIGSMMGSAIFIVPAEITRTVGSRSAGLAVWSLAGILSLCGALCFAELAAMMPEAGGQYVYLREAHGPLVGFLSGWMFFLAAQSGGIAAIAVGLAHHLASVLPLSAVWQERVVAGGVIVLLTGINYCGVRISGQMQSLLTAINVGVVIALITLGYALARRSAGAVVSLSVASGLQFWGSIGVAMAAALWAYDGWNSLTFAAGEVVRPGRTIPLSLVIGTGAVVGLYLGLNLLYYHVLTIPEVAQSSRVAADSATRILGPMGSALVSLAVIVAAFGSTNVSILGGARIYYAMAKDGLFFRWCAAVHPRFRTPHLALLAQALWSLVLVSLAGYEELFTYTVFAAWIFYALAAFGLILLRRRRPELQRPYRVWAYPWIPIIFVLTAVAFLVNTLLAKPVEAGWGCLLVALGVPAYLLWKRTLPHTVREGVGGG